MDEQEDQHVLQVELEDLKQPLGIVPAVLGHNTVRYAHNVNFGVNYGIINQNTTIRHSEKLDLFAVLNPVLDASHTRNLKVSPPNSACFPGTRLGVTKDIRAWADSGLIFDKHPHILWIYGYAGCGKSAIAQEVATYFRGKGRLAGDFFFFRGAGDRATVRRFANNHCKPACGSNAFEYSAHRGGDQGESRYSFIGNHLLAHPVPAASPRASSGGHPGSGGCVSPRQVFRYRP
ncbi:hypothetical protein FA13DRAFT_76157 [Coprinellus micaceus]|uniref:Nephrocystin 3-like N-terminal domain-containing protein n=1 Tax=Coprinellus micaceus TaxID=71717 RepID=A0A4Y7TJT0_COPMI|nr:hypothetical protein FA13DRAFT_76157 [Coprinellus micaceus]